MQHEEKCHLGKLELSIGYASNRQSNRNWFQTEKANNNRRGFFPIIFVLSLLLPINCCDLHLMNVVIKGGGGCRK